MQMSRCGPRHTPLSLVLQTVCTTQPPPRPAFHWDIWDSHTKDHCGHLEHLFLKVMFMFDVSNVCVKIYNLDFRPKENK